jgi:hypothetical protein
VHGEALRGAGFVDDALKKAADGSVRERAFIVALRVGQDFIFAIGLVQRDAGLLLDAADFQGAVRALIKELDEFLVDFIDAAAPVSDVHVVASRSVRGALPRLREPARQTAACKKKPGRSARDDNLDKGSKLVRSWQGLATGEAVASRVFERLNAVAKRGAPGFDRGGFFNFGDESGADDSSIHKAT